MPKKWFLRTTELMRDQKDKSWLDGWGSMKIWRSLEINEEQSGSMRFNQVPWRSTATNNAQYDGYRNDVPKQRTK